MFLSTPLAELAVAPQEEPADVLLVGGRLVPLTRLLLLPQVLLHHRQLKLDLPHPPGNPLPKMYSSCTNISFLDFTYKGSDLAPKIIPFCQIEST